MVVLRALPWLGVAFILLTVRDWFGDAGSELGGSWQTFVSAHGRLATFLLLFAGSAALKIAHELGHALAMGAASGSSTEVGVRLFYGLPQYYANTAGIVLVPRRWDRATILTSGVAIELLIAFALRAVSPMVSPPVKFVLLVFILVVIPTSLIVNWFAPFHRNDGYFLVEELTQTYNLRHKAREAARREFFGSTASPQRPAWLSWYGLAEAMANSGIVIAVIGWLFSLVGYGTAGVMLGLLFGILAFAATLGLVQAPQLRHGVTSRD